MELEGKTMKVKKVSEYTIKITPRMDIDNDETIYSDFEKELGELMEKFFFIEEWHILLSVDFKHAK